MPKFEIRKSYIIYKQETIYKELTNNIENLCQLRDYDMARARSNFFID